MFRALLGKPDLVQQSSAFRRRLARLKSELGETEFPWYPYDSLGNVPVLEQLLRGRFRGLLEESKASRVLDIGGADGELAFFLESLGFRVTVIDYPETNHNGMRGIHRLKQALQSSVEILTVDVDSRFELPDQSYDLVICLGILYHLKNPYFLLELLARHANFCLLSTRVARFAPDGTDIHNIPAAYLLGPDELNQDWTNYWIFTEPGLKRLLFRTGWEVCRYVSVGDTKSSTPDGQDERAFCLVRNRRRTDPALTAGLVQGWHELEEGHWRWTERTFSVEFDTADIRGDVALELEFVYPDALKARTECLQLQASLADTIFPAAVFRTAGEHVYRARIGKHLLRDPKTLVRFELDQALPPDASDRRERGIVVLSVGLH